ncbi:MAG TPA: PAS domain S-box protein [Mucilaginibacter sp.]|nr:PAS domain S-box protein [Mucilaginibacter sp.]
MESNLAFLFEQSSDFFCLLSNDGFIIKTNAALRDTLGYDEEDVNGKKANSFSHPADIKRREELFKQLSANGEQTATQESRIRAKNGRYYNIRWTVFCNPQDQLIYATGINLTSGIAPKAEKGIDNIHHIIQSFNEGFCIIDADWQVISFNPAFQAITGMSSDELVSINLRQLSNLGLTEQLLNEFATAFSKSISSQVQYFNTHFKRWLRVNIFPYNGEAAIFIRDITNIKNQQLTLALEKNILELNASAQHTLSQTVNQLLKGIEEIFPDMICSVLEMDDAQEKLYHLAAPRLPIEYCMAIDGSRIGPQTGSCGTAAYHRTQIIVSDIENDPLWSNYKQLVLPHGLKACWSTPIISSNTTRVLATFAVYYTAKREPKPEELQMIERTANILRVLIENKRSRDHVKDQNRRLQEIASISSHEIRRPVATILGLTNLFDPENMDNPMNIEIIKHIDSTARELDVVIHTIVEKTIYLKEEEDN